MARKTQGRIFKRGKAKVFWADYSVEGKRFRHALKDINGAKVTDRETAQKLLNDLVNPFRLRDKTELARQLADTVKALEEKTAEAVEIANPPLKIADAWETFIKSPARPDSGERTIFDYRGYCNAFIDWLDKEHAELIYLRDVSRDIAGKYAAYMTSSGKSPNTFNKHVGFLKMFYRVLADEIRAKVNPFDGITRKKLKTESRRELTIQELYRVLNEAEGDLALLLNLGTFTGLRLGDCCTLQWGEIDLIKRVIRRIPNKTASKNPKPVLVGIPGPLYDLLNAIPISRRKGFLLPQIAAVYSDINRRPIITRHIQAHFEKCGIQTQKQGTGRYKDPETGELKSTGKRAVVEVGFHSLRHTYVSLHAERGTPQAVIQSNVGHGSPAMTRHYTHIGEAAARNTAAVLEMPLAGNPKSTDPEREQLKQLADTLPLETVKEVLQSLE